jgi:hypothetical protein
MDTTTGRLAATCGPRSLYSTWVSGPPPADGSHWKVRERETYDAVGIVGRDSHGITLLRGAESHALGEDWNIRWEIKRVEL